MIPLLAIYGGMAAAKAGLGLYQYFEGKKRARNNNIDNQVVSKELLQNRSLAQRMAREGIAEQSYKNQLEGINRNVSTGIRALQTGRNQGGVLANIIANANRSTNNLNALDAEARLRNQNLVMRYNEMIGNEKRRGYEQEAMTAQALTGAGIQNIAGAFDTFGSGAMGASELQALTGGAGGDMPTTQTMVARESVLPLTSRKGKRSLYERNLAIQSPNLLNG